MILRNITIALTAMAWLGASTPLRPRVSCEPGASLKGYQVFIVAPVTDQTGARFNLDVSDSLRQQLVRRLRSHGLTALTEAPEDTDAAAIVVASTLVDFRGIPMWLQVPSRGVTGCELRSELRDNRSGRKIGEIVAADLSEEFTPLMVLRHCAHDVADAIDRQLRH
jgi:hypothetical protein